MPRSLLVNLIAVSLCVYVVSNVGHEVAGHGLTCIATGAKLKAISANYIDCDREGLGALPFVLTKAAGTTINIIFFLISLLLLRGEKTASLGRYALWLMMTVNGLQAGGYFLFSGLMKKGDWSDIAALAPEPMIVRIALAILGGLTYWGVVRLSLKYLQEFVGRENRKQQSKWLCLVPYVTGAIAYIGAGVLAPQPIEILFISAAAASLGGTSALAWMHDLPDKWKWRLSETSLSAPKISVAWIVAAAVFTVIFVGVLGPQITL